MTIVTKIVYVYKTDSSLNFGTRPYPRHKGIPQLVAYLSHTFQGRGPISCFSPPSPDCSAVVVREK